MDINIIPINIIIMFSNDYNIHPLVGYIGINIIIIISILSVSYIDINILCLVIMDINLLIK